MVTDLDVTIAERLAAAGQRYTFNRQSLVHVLCDAGKPLALTEVLTADPSLAQSSAYRNLVVLEEAGIVERVTATDEFARYELAEDLTGHHHHLLCSGCGAVDDFTLPARVEQTMEAALKTASRKSGFQPSHHRLDLVGLCTNCA